jgi:tRNA pseudouridine38-40 synthase
VQHAVETALGFVADAPLAVTCAGRTDAGVHAACQVVHFDSEAARSVRAWLMGGNSRLPASVRFLWCHATPENFHARYSARARRYRYRILNRKVAPALQRQWNSWERLPLDAPAMHRAAQALLGEHNFSAYRTAQCQARHPNRDLQEIVVAREGEVVTIEVQANAFLHHMVRNIVGSLLLVGRGEQPESWPGELLRGRDRTVAGPTAPPAGLVFLAPFYPAEFGLPASVTL